MGKVKDGRLSGAAGDLVFYSYNDTLGPLKTGAIREQESAMK